MIAGARRARTLSLLLLVTLLAPFVVWIGVSPAGALSGASPVPGFQACVQLGLSCGSEAQVLADDVGTAVAESLPALTSATETSLLSSLAGAALSLTPALPTLFLAGDSAPHSDVVKGCVDKLADTGGYPVFNPPFGAGYLMPGVQTAQDCPASDLLAYKVLTPQQITYAPYQRAVCAAIYRQSLSYGSGSVAWTFPTSAGFDAALQGLVDSACPAAWRTFFAGQGPAPVMWAPLLQLNGPGVLPTMSEVPPAPPALSGPPDANGNYAWCNVAGVPWEAGTGPLEADVTVSCNTNPSWVSTSSIQWISVDGSLTGTGCSGGDFSFTHNAGSSNSFTAGTLGRFQAETTLTDGATNGTCLSGHTPVLTVTAVWVRWNMGGTPCGAFTDCQTGAASINVQTFSAGFEPASSYPVYPQQWFSGGVSGSAGPGVYYAHFSLTATQQIEAKATCTASGSAPSGGMSFSIDGGSPYASATWAGVGSYSAGSSGVASVTAGSPEVLTLDGLDGGFLPGGTHTLTVSCPAGTVALPSVTPAPAPAPNPCAGTATFVYGVCVDGGTAPLPAPAPASTSPTTTPAPSIVGSSPPSTVAAPPTEATGPSTNNDFLHLGDRIVTALTSLGNFIVTGIVSALQSLVGALQGTLNWGFDLLDSALGWLGSLLQWIGGLLQQIASILTAGFSAVASGLQTVVAAIGSMVSAVVGAIGALVGELVAQLQVLFIPSGTAFQGQVTQLQTAYQATALGSAVGTVQALLDGITGGIGTALSDPAVCPSIGFDAISVPVPGIGTQTVPGFTAHLPGPDNCPGNGPNGALTDQDNQARDELGYRTLVRGLVGFAMVWVFFWSLAGGAPWARMSEQMSPGNTIGAGPTPGGLGDNSVVRGVRRYYGRPV